MQNMLSEVRMARSTSVGYVKPALLILLLWTTQFGQADGIDWNSDQISWRGYKEGLAEAEEKGKSIMLVFYADWCPVCHMYESLFDNDVITEMSHDIVMVRVDIQKYPNYSAKYSEDGNYTPRIYLLDTKAAVLPIYSDHPLFRHFFPPTDLQGFGTMMAKVSAARIPGVETSASAP